MCFFASNAIILISLDTRYRNWYHLINMLVSKNDTTLFQVVYLTIITISGPLEPGEPDNPDLPSCPSCPLGP
jgi:hypothetical protein